MNVTLVATDKTPCPVPNKPEVTIGRSIGCDIVVPLGRASVSRKHCILIQKDSQISVQDEGSTNGTKLNKNEIKGKGPQVLKNGDVLEIAGLEFKVMIGTGESQKKDNEEPVLTSAETSSGTAQSDAISNDVLAGIQKEVGATPTVPKPKPVVAQPKPIAVQPKPVVPTPKPAAPAAPQTQAKKEPAKWSPPPKVESAKSLVAQAQAQQKKPEKKGFLAGLFSKKDKKPVVKKK